MARRIAQLRATDDEALAEAARDGDHLAFGELYRRYEPIFAAYVVPRLGEGAADAIQETFLRILRGLPLYKGPRFFPWAYRICVNRVADELRGRRRRPGDRPAATPTGGSEPAGGAPTPEELLVAKRLGVRLGAALDALPEGQRAVFLLARVEGLPYGEIAELLGLPVGTVKSRMFAAVRALFPAEEGEER